MPNNDKTGPAGQGPMTGQGQGSCTENKPANFIGNGRGRGMKCCQNGRGQGRFFQKGNTAFSLDD